MIVIFKLFNCSGVQDEKGNHFVAYFKPTKESMEKRRAERAAGEHDPDHVWVLSVVFE